MKVSFSGGVHVDQNNIQLDIYIDGMNDSKINPNLGLKIFSFIFWV